MKTFWLAGALFVGAMLAACAGGDVRRTHDFNLTELNKDALLEQHGQVAALEVRGPYLAARERPGPELYSALRGIPCETWSGQIRCQ